MRGVKRGGGKEEGKIISNETPLDKACEEKNDGKPM